MHGRQTLLVTGGTARTAKADAPRRLVGLTAAADQYPHQLSGGMNSASVSRAGHLVADPRRPYAERVGDLTRWLTATRQHPGATRAGDGLESLEPAPRGPRRSPPGACDLDCPRPGGVGCHRAAGQYALHVYPSAIAQAAGRLVASGELLTTLASSMRTLTIAGVNEARLLASIACVGAVHPVPDVRKDRAAPVHNMMTVIL